MSILHISLLTFGVCAGGLIACHYLLKVTDYDTEPKLIPIITGFIALFVAIYCFVAILYFFDDDCIPQRVVVIDTVEYVKLSDVEECD